MSSPRRRSSTTSRRSSLNQQKDLLSLAEMFELINIAPGERMEHFRKTRITFREACKLASENIFTAYQDSKACLITLQSENRQMKIERNIHTMLQVYEQKTTENEDNALRRFDDEWRQMEVHHQESFKQLMSFAKQCLNIIKTASKSMKLLENTLADFDEINQLSTKVHKLIAEIKTAPKDVKISCGAFMPKLFAGFALLNGYREKHDIQRQAEIAMLNKRRLPERLAGIFRRKVARRNSLREMEELQDIQHEATMELQIIDTECKYMQKEVEQKDAEVSGIWLSEVGRAKVQWDDALKDLRSTYV